MRTADRASLESLYRQLPGVKCIPGCTDCCAHVAMSRLEFEGLTEEERAKWAQLSFSCPMVIEGVGCSIYDKRPFCCRLFGTGHMVRCIRGCKPDEPLSTMQTLEVVETYKREFF
jgi:hypothetical protein